MLCVAVPAIGLAQFDTTAKPVDKSLGMSVEQKLGSQVPAGSEFKDQDGKVVHIGDYFGKRPILIAPQFYSCAGVCDMERTSMVKTITRMAKTEPVGKVFDLVVLGIHPKETPDLAKAKANEMAGLFAKYGLTMEGVHMLTGDLKNIREVTDSLGFTFKYDADRGLINHPACIMMLTPKGRVSSYLFGAEYPTAVVKRDISISSREEINQPAEPILLGCIMVDPVTGQRTLVVKQALKVTGFLTAFILALSIFSMHKKSKQGEVQIEELGGAAS